MEPRARDLIGIAVLTLVLALLVVGIVLAAIPR
jgi:hypothetical protein